jgi:hypothetical protein
VAYAVLFLGMLLGLKMMDKRMKDLKKVSTEEDMQEWIEKLGNADIVLPDGDFRWWRCGQCYDLGSHNGPHYRNMLRTPIEIDGTLVFALRDLVVEKGIDDMNAFTHNLHDIWVIVDDGKSDFETWVEFYVKPWEMVKAACLILNEK